MKVGADPNLVAARRSQKLRLGRFPQAAHTITRLVAGVCVFDEVVQRLAFVCPLPRAVGAHDDVVVANRLCAGSHSQWRPVGGACVIARGRAASLHILAEEIQSLAGGADERPVSGLGRRTWRLW